MMPTRPSAQGAYLLFIFCVALVAPAFGQSSIEARPRSEPPPTLQRYEQLNERVRQTPDAQVLFFGDSITQQWEEAGLDIWNKRFAPLRALNLGIASDRTENVLWRLRNGNLDGVNPAVIVLMIGTNNIRDISTGGSTVAQTAAGVAAIVRELRERLPRTRILLLGILPRGENPNEIRGAALQVNQIIRNFADGRSVIWLDFGHRYVDKDGLISRTFMPDYLHLSEQGYAIWAEEIEGAIAAALHVR